MWRAVVPALIRIAMVIGFGPTAHAFAALAAGPPLLVGDGERRRLVAVIRAPDADGGCQEIVTRIIAELMAGGVPVVALTCPSDDLECMAVSGVSVSAIVLVQRRNNIRAVEVRAGAVFESSGRPSPVVARDFGRVQRVADSESGGGASALAVRTVELLRAMLMEVADSSSASSSSASTGDPGPAADVAVRQSIDPEPVSGTKVKEKSAPVPTGSHNFTIKVGAAVIGGFSRLDAAYGPALSVGRLTSPHVLLSVTLAGPAFGRDQSNELGTVSIRHEMAKLEASLVGLFWNRLVLRAGVGGGLYHIHVDGQINNGGGMFVDLPPPSMGSAGAFSWLLSWSAGIVANLRPDFGLFLDGGLFVLTPTQVIKLGGLEVGRAGSPGMVVTGGVELRL
jgi:hypothetical protein